MKTSELTGTALNWAVATCEGLTDYDHATETMLAPRKEYGRVNLDEYSYSTDWAQGGPIIEREGVWVAPTTTGQAWDATRSIEGVIYRAPTPLIAAMRCYVASKLGNEVEIPKELT